MAGITRFAPSPTGPLHLGHAYSAILSHDRGRAGGGSFLIRFEDIDTARCRPEWEVSILDDLAWLGLTWDAPPLRQSARKHLYQDALQTLWTRGLIYRCTCSRADIEAALGAPQEGAPRPTGPDGTIYPGTCRNRPGRGDGCCPTDAHLRLDMQRALACADPDGRGIAFVDSGPGHEGTHRTRPETYCRNIGDVVLARRDFGTSYHLSVVLDDAEQAITEVVRGEDLFEATRIHALLQRLFDLPQPTYHHHVLIRDEAGKRLAKRDNARAIGTYRAQGATPADIRRLVGL